MGPPPGAPFCQEVPGKFPPRQGILWVCDRGKEGDSVEWKKRRRILWGAWALALGLAVSAWFVSLPDVPALPAGQTAAALPPKGYLALTFDDGPWPKTTEALLDGLAQRGVKATFFLVGEQVADHQDTVRRMAVGAGRSVITTCIWLRYSRRAMPVAISPAPRIKTLMRQPLICLIPMCSTLWSVVG